MIDRREQTVRCPTCQKRVVVRVIGFEDAAGVPVKGECRHVFRVKAFINRNPDYDDPEGEYD